MVQLRDRKNVLVCEMQILETGDNEMKDSFFTGVDVSKGQIAAIHIELLVGRTDAVEDAGQRCAETEENPELRDRVIGRCFPDCVRVGLELEQQGGVEEMTKIGHSCETVHQVEA